MAAFPGFPSNTRFTPVPDALMGPLLEEMDGLPEVKAVLRMLYLLHRKKGFPQAVGLQELKADPVLRRVFNGQGQEDARLHEALNRAVRRGILLEARPQDADQPLYLLNTEANQRYLAWKGAIPTPPEAPAAMGEEPFPQAEQDIFTLYEENIGVLTPLIVEELKEAEASYPARWVREAVREAVRSNRRSWRYVARILERWQHEGRGHGEPGRHPAASDPKAYLRGWRRSTR